MAWYWPKIEDEPSAEAATKPAVGASCFVAAVTGLLAVLSIFYHKPIVGLDGWGLVDAIIFALIAWRISKVSRAWAVVGLLMYLLEVGYKLATNPSSALGIVTIIFILTYINGIRGTFAYHQYRKSGIDPLAPSMPQS
jgi:ABC-type polysaccharide/polyol phosphate export permease